MAAAIRFSPQNLPEKVPALVSISHDIVVSRTAV
jgi:hypothetical protein